MEEMRVTDVEVKNDSKLLYLINLQRLSQVSWHEVYNN